MCADSLIYFFWGENILKWQNYNDGDLDIDDGGDDDNGDDSDFDIDDDASSMVMTLM